MPPSELTPYSPLVSLAQIPIPAGMCLPEGWGAPCKAQPGGDSLLSVGQAQVVSLGTNGDGQTDAAQETGLGEPEPWAGFKEGLSPGCGEAGGLLPPQKRTRSSLSPTPALRPLTKDDPQRRGSASPHQLMERGPKGRGKDPGFNLPKFTSSSSTHELCDPR